jgi:hypothetical protein
MIDRILGNFALIKLDPNYNFKILQGPNGTEIELAMVYTGESEVNGYSISGTLIAAPEKPFFFDRHSFHGSQREFAACMKESLEVDCDFNFRPGDKIYFNYNAQLNALEEDRIIDMPEHGHCMLIPYHALFGYTPAADPTHPVIPVNGYVFFRRDETPTEVTFAHGLIGIQKANPYGSNYATVEAADAPVRRYQDGQPEPRDPLVKGDRILIDKRFGFRMAYDTHAGELKGVEVMRRKSILAII